MVMLVKVSVKLFWLVFEKISFKFWLLLMWWCEV